MKLGRNSRACSACPVLRKYEGHIESKERFAIKKYLLIIGKKRICRFYHTPSLTSPHSHLGH